MSSFAARTHQLEYEQGEHIPATNSNDALLQGFAPRQKMSLHLSPWRRVLPWILHSLLLLTSIAFFLSGRLGVAKCPQSWFPIVGSHAPVHSVRFHGNLEYSSPFKGPPTKAVDEAWDSIAPLGVMSIPEDIYKTLNSSKHAVKVPAEAGGGYMAVFESIHLIHCVRSLWETTYSSYYTAQHAMSLEQPSEWHAHLDHCADMLRQKLMCDADANLITYNWITNHYAPKPNFNVQHQCRNYHHLLSVAARQRVDGSRFANGWILRPSDKSFVEFEEPPFDPDADL